MHRPNKFSPKARKIGWPMYCCLWFNISPCFRPIAKWIVVDAKGSSNFAVFLIAGSGPCCVANTQNMYCVNNGWCWSDHAKGKLFIWFCKMFIISLAGLFSPQLKWGHVLFKLPKNLKVTMWCFAPQVNSATRPHLTLHDGQKGVKPQYFLYRIRITRELMFVFHYKIWNSTQKWPFCGEGG